jgi:TonB family protein
MPGVLPAKKKRRGNIVMLLTSCRATSRQSGRSSDASGRRALSTLLVAVGSGLTTLPALAQPAQAPNEVAPSERAKRDADKVFHWIMIQGDRTRKATAAGAKDAKDVKDVKDERPAAKPLRVAAPDAVPARAKADATVAGAEPSSPKPVGKAAEKPAGAAASIGTPAGAADSAKPEDARLARAEPASRAAAPAVEASDAPQGLVALSQPAPQFPVNIMRTLRRGTVQVQFNVLPDGSVANVEVLKTSSARLNAAALEAVGQWRFRPVAKMQTGAVEVGFDLE